MYVIAGPLCSSIPNPGQARVSRRGTTCRGPGGADGRRQLARAETGAVDDARALAQGLVEAPDRAALDAAAERMHAGSQPLEIDRGLDDGGRECVTKAVAGRQQFGGRRPEALGSGRPARSLDRARVDLERVAAQDTGGRVVHQRLKAPQAGGRQARDLVPG
jgi:hypothetical protein